MAEIRGVVGSRVRELRVAQRLTQEQLGERAGLSYKFIGEIERGVGNPTIQTLAEIAGALGVDIADLVSGGRMQVNLGHFSSTDLAVVRDARDSLATLLRRATTTRRGRKKR